MGTQNFDNVLPPRRAANVLAHFDGEPITNKGALDKGITWLENIAGEAEPRGPGHLAPHEAAALVNAYHAGIRRAGLDEDATAALLWVEARAKGCTLE